MKEVLMKEEEMFKEGDIVIQKNGVTAKYQTSYEVLAVRSKRNSVVVKSTINNILYDIKMEDLVKISPKRYDCVLLENYENGFRSAHYLDLGHGANCDDNIKVTYPQTHYGKIYKIVRFVAKNITCSVAEPIKGTLYREIGTV